MIGYASRTGTKRNLNALRENGWRLMVSARGVLRTEGFRYALDNGAWTSSQRNEPFDTMAFERAVDQLGAGADFIVIPDIVNGGIASLTRSRRWWEKLRFTYDHIAHVPLLIAVQNGFEPRDVAPLLSPRTGIFIGGTSGWKEHSLRRWATLARTRGAICHVGRVNTARRIRLCEAAGVTSFDGSSASRFAVTARPLELARQQTDIEGYIARLAA
jgi:hypothetical protein